MTYSIFTPPSVEDCVQITKKALRELFCCHILEADITRIYATVIRSDFDFSDPNLSREYEQLTNTLSTIQADYEETISNARKMICSFLQQHDSSTNALTEALVTTLTDTLTQMQIETHPLHVHELVQKALSEIHNSIN